MIIRVRAVPNAKKKEVKEEGSMLKVYISAPAADNKANIKLIEILSNYLNVKKGSLSIQSGHKSGTKLLY